MSKAIMKVVIVGATKGMGRSLARQLGALGHELFLLGIDPEEMERSAADLQVRTGKPVGTALCDMENCDTFAPALDLADAALGGFDTVIITAALFATQEQLEANIELTRRLVTVNYANTVVLCEHVRRRLLARGGGRLVVFSSVAGDRGRKPVILYGSSKAGISRYLEGLDHKFHSAGLITLCVKPGFVKTTMTAGLKPPPFAGEPDQVAREVIRAMERKKPVLYTPAMWALVMLVIRFLPRFVMRKIGF
jgi:decaprenylphospho-beta-D-erythro-pentofuranosid-2-ulose 2-reductase